MKILLEKHRNDTEMVEMYSGDKKWLMAVVHQDLLGDEIRTQLDGNDGELTLELTVAK